MNMSTINRAPAEPSHNPIRMAEVLAAFSLATDLGTGKSMGHALRACYLGMVMARELRLSNSEQAELYYSFLLMHSGCAALSLTMAPIIQGDELAAIADITLRDDSSLREMLGWMSRHVSPDAPLPTRVLKLIRALLHIGPLFSPECFAALAEELGGTAPQRRLRREWPAGLTDREVEVLQHVAKGDTNRQIAQGLVISERTVAHHLEHIYDKIGISSRAAAVFFAMEHELIL